MTDKTGHLNRPGAGPTSTMMYIDGLPLNVYLNYNPYSGRWETAKPMPPGEQDVLVKDFADEGSAWAWAREEFSAGRLPLQM